MADAGAPPPAVLAAASTNDEDGGGKKRPKTDDDGGGVGNPERQQNNHNKKKKVTTGAARTAGAVAAAAPFQSSITSFFKRSPSKSAKNNVRSGSGGDDASASGAAASNDDDVDALPEDDGKPIVPFKVEEHRVSRRWWKVYDGACIYRQVSKNVEGPRTKVAAFDLDGTVLSWRLPAGGWPSRFEHYELWNRDLISKMRSLHDDDGYKLVVFSNQGAVRGAHAGKKATLVKDLVDWLAVCAVRRPMSCVMSCDKRRGYHKPSPKMWSIMEECCNGGLKVDASRSFYVGDSVGGDDDPQGGVDIGFARNVGVRFYPPEDYFGPSAKDRRSRDKLAMQYEAPPDSALKARADLVGGGLSSGPLLLLLCGSQGSGKSHFCRQIAGGGGWLHFSQDTINSGRPGKREAVEKAVEEALRRGERVAVDRMHLDRTQRSNFIEVARKAAGDAAAVPVHAVVLTPPAEIVSRRVRDRRDHPSGFQGESKARIAASSAGRIEIPSYEEGFDLVSVASTVEGTARLVSFYKKNVAAPTSTVVPASFRLAGDVTLPSIALGTMGLGRKEAERVVSEAVELGIAAFDTAPTYNNEDKVGLGLWPSSFRIVKVPKRATTAQQMRQELTDSLSKLQTNLADLLLLHWPSDVVAAGTLKEVWQAMEQCVKEGLAKSIGVSNFNVGGLRMLIPQCTVRPAVNQVERHPLLPQWDLVDFCAQNDILLQAHTPLGQGNSDLLENEVVKDVGSRNKRSPAQVCIMWNLQQGFPVVPKCSSREHLEDVLAATSGDPLPAGDMKAINALKLRRRFVAPPFMYGSEQYCWGEQK